VAWQLQKLHVWRIVHFIRTRRHSLLHGLFGANRPK
jgi:hypothetical protein